MKTTMVITTYERADLLKGSLRRLSRLTSPDEIIVVDDGGADHTKDVCLDAQRELPITYIYNDNPGPTICSLARNIGVRHAQHPWIITTEPELIYVTDIVAQFKELKPRFQGSVISAGQIFFAPAEWKPENDPAVLDPEIPMPSEWESAIGWVAPHTAIYEKEWLEAIGGWDESFPGTWGWDDTDLLTRLRLTGHGQHSSLLMQAVHQYHGLGGDDFGYNEQHFLNKTFNQDETDLSQVVANRGSWGVLKGLT